MKPGKLTWMILFLVCLMVVAPLLLVGDAEFGGADGEAEMLIMEMAPDYEPWFSPVFEPVSVEIESLLFSMQAAIGAGILGYGIAYLKYGKKEAVKHDH